MPFHEQQPSGIQENFFVFQFFKPLLPFSMQLLETHGNDEPVGINNRKQRCVINEDRIHEDVRTGEPRLVEIVRATRRHVPFRNVTKEKKNLSENFNFQN